MKCHQILFFLNMKGQKFPPRNDPDCHKGGPPACRKDDGDTDADYEQPRGAITIFGVEVKILVSKIKTKTKYKNHLLTLFFF